MEKPYRILLVDDEEEVRTSIIKNINWEETGFTVVGDAENGEDALEKIEQLEPDLVLTDIRMPYMDGLTLAKKIRQTRPSMKIIIFSGFDDFEYAKEAIKLNIIEYILKPVNAEELTEILKRIKLNLDEEIAKLKDVRALKECFEKNLPILKSNFLNDLVNDRIRKQQLPILLKEYQIPLHTANYWLVAQIYIHSFSEKNIVDPLDNEKGLLPLSVVSIVNSHISQYCNCFATFHSSSIICSVIGMEDTQKLSEVITALNEVSRESKRMLDLRLTIGIGSPSNRLDKLGKSYKEAGEAISYRDLSDSGDVIYIGDMETTQDVILHLDRKAEGDLIAALKFGVEEKILDCIDEIIGRMNSVRLHQSDYQAYIISILNVVLQVIQRYELDPESIFGCKADYYQILMDINDSDALKSWVTKTCLKISENLKDERNDSTQNMIHSAKKYIRTNYSNSNLSLEMVCNHLHISVTYFSTVFKREVGESYTSYLTRIRLEKAAELLATTDDKTYLIAKEVGYEEPNYFGYVFKKTYGVSPNKYRGK